MELIAAGAHLDDVRDEVHHADDEDEVAGKAHFSD